MGAAGSVKSPASKASIVPVEPVTGVTTFKVRLKSQRTAAKKQEKEKKKTPEASKKKGSVLTPLFGIWHRRCRWVWNWHEGKSVVSSLIPMAYIKTRQPRGRQGMNRAIGWDCSQRHGIGQHHMPSYVYIKISSRPGLFFFGFPNIPVFLAWIGSWTWFLKHQSRVAIAKPREVVKKAISNTLV